MQMRHPQLDALRRDGGSRTRGVAGDAQAVAHFVRAPPLLAIAKQKDEDVERLFRSDLLVKESVQISISINHLQNAT